jgi:peptide/nickel transport system ATP-binding protein
LEFYHRLQGADRDRRIAELLDLTRLPADVATRRASELSGGQKQRINLARALAADPDLILCDEVTSALDTVVGAAILDLLAELRRELSVSFMFISHDISTVRSICDDVVVLYAGRKVESGARQTFAAPPFHPYTHLLISSVPEMRRGWLEETTVAQAPPPMGPGAAGSGPCSFLSRCPVRIDGLCNVTPPPRTQLGGGHEDLCHRSADELRRLQAPQSPIAAA